MKKLFLVLFALVLLTVAGEEVPDKPAPAQVPAASGVPVRKGRRPDLWENFDILAVRYPEEAKKIRELFRKDRPAAVMALSGLDRRERDRRRNRNQELRELGKEAKADPNSLPFLKEKLVQVYQEDQAFLKQYRAYMEKELKKIREADVTPSAEARLEARFLKECEALEKMTGSSQDEFVRRQVEKLTAPGKSRKKKAADR